MFVHQAKIRKPNLAQELAWIGDQLSTIALVHGLVERGENFLEVTKLSIGIVNHLSESHGIAINFKESIGPSSWVLPESEAATFALVVTELLSNAAKHGSADDVAFTIEDKTDYLICRITNIGQLAGDPMSRPTPVSGLAILKLLVADPDTALRLYQRNGQVHAEYRIEPPYIDKVT